MKDFNKPPYEPVNASEHFMHAMVIRLDALCHMVNSLVEHVAKQEGITSERVTEEIISLKEEVKPKKTARTRKKQGV